MKPKLIVALVNDEKTDTVIEAARAGGATGATIATACGASIASKVIAENRAPERVNVYEVMSKPVLTLPSEMQARYAVRLLARFGVSRAVVVDHDRNPVGLATMRDLVLGHVEE